jgi:hypothetical protein
MVLAWTDSRNGSTDLYVQRIDPEGRPTSGWPDNGLRVIAPPASVGAWDAAPDGAGGAFVEWVGLGGSPAYQGVFIVRISGNGTVAAGWPATGVELDSRRTSISANFGNPALVSDGEGGAIPYWWASGTYCIPDEYCYYYQGYNRMRITPGGQGDPGWQGVGVGDFNYLQPVRGSSGTHMVLYQPNWQCGVYPSYYNCSYPIYDLYLNDYSSSGQPVWTASLSLARGYEYEPALVADGSGGFLSAWTVHDDLYGVRLNENGAVACGWVWSGSPICTRPGEQEDVRIVPDASGGGLFAWQDERDGDWDIYGLRMTGEGAVHADWAEAGNPMCRLPGDQVALQLVSADPLSAIAVWQDSRSGEADIYAQRVTFDAPTPTQLTLVSAESEPGRVRLVWHTPEGANVIAVVLRGEEGSPWKAVANVASDASGRIVFDDSSVESGRRYGYRLALQGESGEEFAGETWVDVPAAYALSLGGLRPNPATREVVVAFTLPREAPAMLHLVDLAGRIVASREVGSLGPGRHTVELGKGGRIAAGVYFLRLTQGRQSLTARACVVR